MLNLWDVDSNFALPPWLYSLTYKQYFAGNVVMFEDGTSSVLESSSLKKTG
jgi:hypothetical protein